MEQYKQPVIITCVPCDLYFAAEVELQVENFRKFGYSSQLRVLVFEPGENLFEHYWQQLVDRYSEVQFYFYNNPNLVKLTTIYQPVIRPYCLGEHWKQYPELEQQTILYLDTDVLFTQAVDFSKYLHDDICYMSKTPYIGAGYFASKRKDVYQFKLAEYDQINVLAELCAVVGIDKQVVIDNEDNTGGCQYLLKSIDQYFWEDLLKDCIALRMKATSLNGEYFPSEDAGLQSWAIGDMCGLLWNLWKRGKVTACPGELDFCWSSSPIEKYDQCIFYHNAGISGKFMEMNGVKHKMFHKGDIRFRTNSMTFFDLSYSGISEDYCSIMYVKAIEELKPTAICKTNNLVY